jgi:hypothetical protein
VDIVPQKAKKPGKNGDKQVLYTIGKEINHIIEWYRGEKCKVNGLDLIQGQRSKHEINKRKVFIAF